MTVQDFILGFSAQIWALMAMGACYFLLFTEKMNRAVITMILGAALVVLGVISQEEAIASIDFNTISLLVGMMVIINIAGQSGMFQFAAIWGTKKVRAHPAGILVVLAGVTAVFSAFLDNVTTVLLIIPVTIQITEKLKVNPYPYLVLIIFASNIGGTATLIGDPPNILIGSALGLSFTDFLIHLAPVVLVILVLVVAVFFFFWRGKLETTLRNRTRVLQMNEREAITDYGLLYRALIVLGCVIIGFLVAEYAGLDNGFIALTGAALLLLLYTLRLPKKARDFQAEKMFDRVDWTTIYFFMGLFVIVGALEKTGILEEVGVYLSQWTDGSIQKSVYVVLGVSAVFSSLVDNIPFVATMIPVLKSMEEGIGGREAMMPVWWALSLGACLGGNGTLIGASANVIVAGLAAREGKPISFTGFLLWSLPVTVISVLISALYLWVKYFM